MFKHYSIKTVSAVLVVILGVFNVLVFSFFSFRNIERSLYLKEEETAAILMDYSMKTIAERTSLIEELVKTPARDLPESKKEAARELEKIFGVMNTLIPGIKDLVFASAEGAHIGIRELPESYDPRDRIWYINPLMNRGDGSLWTAPYLDYIDQEIQISVSSIVQDERGLLRGVLAVHIPVSSISALFNHFRLPEKDLLMLVSPDGTVLGSKGEYYIGQRLFEDMVSREEFGKDENSFQMEIKGRPYIMHCRILPDSRMYYVCGTSKSKLREALNHQLIRIVILETLFLILYTIFVYLLIRKGLLPLQRLTTLMSEAERGNYKIRAEFNQYREVAELSRQFNNMMDGIKNRDVILKNREIKIKNLAYYDALTGLANRAYLMKILSELLEPEGSPEGALLFLDLDGFKSINDTMGHSTGDLVLQEVASRLSHSTRYRQTAARLGGDEFVILLEEICSIELVSKIADRLLKVLNRPINLKKTKYEIGASIGIVMYPVHGREAGTLLKKADMAMYKAKRSGRNNYQIYEENLEEEILVRTSLEKEIRRSMKEKLFYYNFQPLYSLAENSFHGFEALLRTDNPGLQGFNMEEIVRTAEETGMIVAIERQLIPEGLAYLKKIRSIFHPDLKISLNISSPHLMQMDFVSYILDEIILAGLPNTAVNLEITETMMMDSMTSGKEKLEELRSQGLGIHMDDFGTGYSSLSYLQNLPISCVKIDKTFINVLENDEKKKKIIALIIEMAHNLNLNVVAEGLETSEQLNYLRSIGCDYGQGFYMSRPLSESALLDLLKNEGLAIS